MAACLALALAGVCDAEPAAKAAPAKPTAQQSATFAADFETGLLKTPVYPVMKKYYPDVYAASLREALDGLRAGKSIIALQTTMRAGYQALLKAQLPKAEPRLIYALIDVSRAEAESLVGSPGDCMAILGLAPLKTRADLLVPPDLAKQDLKLLAEILEQTATHPYVRRPEDAHELPTVEQLASIAYDELPSDDSRKRFIQLAGNLRDAATPADQRVVCEYMVGFFTALKSRRRRTPRRSSPAA